MTKRTKRDLLLITFGVCLFAAVNNFPLVLSFFRKMMTLCLPVLSLESAI